MTDAQTPAAAPRRLVRIGCRSGAALAAALLVTGGGVAAYGYWQATSTNAGGFAVADTLQQGATPSVSAAKQDLTVHWAPRTTAGGRAVSGYTVRRYSAATGSASTPATGGCAGIVTTLSCTEAAVPNGTWYYAVTPLLGNWSGQESPRSGAALADGIPPTVSVASVSPTPNASGYNNSSPVVVTLAAQDQAGGSGVASISFTVDGGVPATVAGASATAAVSGDGTHTLVYSATDASGNVSASQSLTVTIDTQAPAAPILTAPAVVNLSNVAAVPLSGSAEALSTVRLTASDGAGHTVSGTASASTTGAWSLPTLNLSSLNDGTVTLSCTAQDAAGNVSTATTATARKDTVSTTPTFTSVPAHITSDDVTSVQVTGTAEANAVAAVTASDGAGHTATGSGTASSAGNWTATLDVSALNSGPITFSVQATDQAGNLSTSATAPSRIGPKVKNVTLVSAGGLGTADAKDQVVVTFSESMDPTTFCSGWTPDGTGVYTQTGSKVTVTINGGTASDSLSVASTNCSASNFGTVLLGAKYVAGTGSLTFNGNGNGGNTSSSVVLSADKMTLTITLGKRNGTPASASGASTPSFRPPVTSATPPGPILTDLSGVPLGTKTVTASTASEF